MTQIKTTINHHSTHIELIPRKYIINAENGAKNQFVEHSETHILYTHRIAHNSPLPHPPWSHKPTNIFIYVWLELEASIDNMLLERKQFIDDRLIVALVFPPNPCIMHKT